MYKCIKKYIFYTFIYLYNFSTVYFVTKWKKGVSRDSQVTLRSTSSLSPLPSLLVAAHWYRPLRSRLTFCINSVSFRTTKMPRDVSVVSGRPSKNQSTRRAAGFAMMLHDMCTERPVSSEFRSDWFVRFVFRDTLGRTEKDKNKNKD